MTMPTRPTRPLLHTRETRTDCMVKEPQPPHSSASHRLGSFQMWDQTMFDTLFVQQAIMVHGEVAEMPPPIPQVLMMSAKQFQAFMAFIAIPSHKCGTIRRAGRSEGGIGNGTATDMYPRTRQAEVVEEVD